ncbi:MAG: dodecin family protein [Rhizobiaceae bacterium]
MAMLKVIEVLSESDESWEDAARQAVANAAKTIRNIKSIYIENFEAAVDGDMIVNYRVNGKITFLLD